MLIRNNLSSKLVKICLNIVCKLEKILFLLVFGLKLSPNLNSNNAPSEVMATAFTIIMCITLAAKMRAAIGVWPHELVVPCVIFGKWLFQWKIPMIFFIRKYLFISFIRSIVVKTRPTWSVVVGIGSLTCPVKLLDQRCC